MAGERFILDPSIVALLRDLGISAGRVLRRAELPVGMFRGEPVALTPGEYFRFWDALDTESANPNLAVAIGRAISVELFSPPLFAALCSPNLAVAARRIAAYKPLIGPMVIDVSSSTAGLTVSFRWPAGMTPPPLLALTELVFWIALARIATRHHVRPVRVTAAKLPLITEAVTEFFGSELRAGPTESITFAVEDATRPFLTENEPMWQFFAPELRRRLADLHAAASSAERVRAALLDLLPAGDSTMTAVARQLATSPRTLQRQLQLEGTTFQSILADTREQLARHYLAHGTMTTAEIAYLLAYEDANSFYRAFRTWTGTTPDTVRTTIAGAAVVG